MLYEQNVQAGFPLQLNVPGRYFLLDSTGDQSAVTVTLLRNGTPIFGQIPGARRGLKIGVDGGFDGVRIEAAGDAVVRFFATFENVSISTTDGANVEIPNGVQVTNDVANAIPVVHTGAVNLTADSVSLLSSSSLVSQNDVAINAGERLQLIAAAGVGVKQREVIIKNLFLNTAAFRVGDADCAAQRGHEIMPGESIVINTLAAVYAWNCGAVGQSVSIISTSR